jgi:3-phosphoshikimate 1-carboxyvinyltransferase
MSSYLVTPVEQVGGELTVPGDKSISHRSLMLGSIAEGQTQVTGFLASEDCLATMAAMQAMGVTIERPSATGLRVQGVGMQGLKRADKPLDLGNSGTAIRLMTGLLAGQSFSSELIGDASLMTRPMERVAIPLRLMGAKIDTANGKPPVRIHGGQRLQGIHYDLPVASAQVKSAIMLAGLYAEGPTTVVEPGVTRDHTERMLSTFGGQVEASRGRISMKPPNRLAAATLQVPADFSSSAFFIVAGLLAAKDLLVLRGVGVNPTRTGLLDMLGLMGADIRLVNHRSAGAEPVADIEIRPSPLKGVVVPEGLVALAIDEFPAFFIAAACAKGETVVTGAAELRVKETDRLAAMADGLKVLGVEAEVLADGLRLAGSAGSRPFAGGTINSHGDHRIAMAFAVASVRATAPIRVLDVDNVATSFPGFVETARSAGLALDQVA